jgi:hypothetical protein
MSYNHINAEAGSKLADILDDEVFRLLNVEVAKLYPSAIIYEHDKGEKSEIRIALGTNHKGHLEIDDKNCKIENLRDFIWGCRNNMMTTDGAPLFVSILREVADAIEKDRQC